MPPHATRTVTAVLLAALLAHATPAADPVRHAFLATGGETFIADESGTVTWSYQPLDRDRFAAFQRGVTKLIEQCRAAGVKQVFLVTPPIYDHAPKAGEVDYDGVLAEYARWELTLKRPGVTAIDLHTAMRKARDGRAGAFSKDKVHPGDDGHLLMARTILAGLGVKAPDEPLATIKADPLFKLVEEKRRLRSAAWMRHVGYTREKTVRPEPLGSAEADAARVREKIDALRRRK